MIHLGLWLFVEVVEPEALKRISISADEHTDKNNKHKACKNTKHRAKTQKRRTQSKLRPRKPQDFPHDHHPPLEPAVARRASGKSEREKI